MFLNRLQKEDETTEEFLTDQRLKSQPCNLGRLTESLIRDLIVIGTWNKKLRKRLLGDPELTLDKVIRICQAKEVTQSRIKLMGDGVDSALTL